MSDIGSKNRENSDKILEETTLSSQAIFEGKIISLQVDTVKLPNGQEATREVVRHPGAVAVLAIKDNKMLAVNQYRQPLGRCEVEIPAGKLEPGEDPLEAAKRELQEETGYTCGTIRKLHSFYTSPGFADEIIHLYLAEDLVSGEMNPDEDEFIEMMEVSLEEAYSLIQAERISDAKTILAVYAWNMYILKGTI